MTTATATPAITTRITFNRETYDFDCYATVEGEEIYLGSRPNFFDGEALCRQYRYDAAIDSYCPEQAAAIAMEPDEAPVDDGPEDNWGGFRCSCGTAEPAYASERAAAVARRLVYCERCGKAGTTTDEDADWYCPDCTAASVKCACGAPATITVRSQDDMYLLCNSCFERDFQRNEARTDAWEVIARRLVYCERCDKVGTTTDEDADWYCPDCAATAQCLFCDRPATITVLENADPQTITHMLCGPCFDREFQHNRGRIDNWQVLARVPSLATYPCETCGIPKPIAGFTQLRADDKHAVCDDCRRNTAVRHSGAIADQGSDDTSYALYELALTDPAALKEFLAGHSLYQRERLAWRFASYLRREHGIDRTPALIARNWDNLIGSEEKSPAAA